VWPYAAGPNYGEIEHGEGVLVTTVGGRNGCCFNAVTGTAPLGLARPRDDDVDNDGDALVDELVQRNGPRRNHSISSWNGPDMRYATIEDIVAGVGGDFAPAPEPLPGRDSATTLVGGCDGDAHMDADERPVYRVRFQSAVEATNVEVTLRAVEADCDSPPGCAPGSASCPDPERANNAPYAGLTITSPWTLSVLPATRRASPFATWSTPTTWRRSTRPTSPAVACSCATATTTRSRAQGSR
jgi:hypothetical protein